MLAYGARRRIAALTVFGALTLTLVTGCTSGHSVGSLGPATPPASSSVSATPTAADATGAGGAPTTTGGGDGTFTSGLTWNWSGRDANSYTSDYSLSVGKVATLAETPLLGAVSQASTLDTLCAGGVANTDGYLPMKLIMRNTSNGFAHTVHSAVSLGGQSSNLGQIAIVIADSAEPECAYSGPADTGVTSQYEAECDNLPPGNMCSQYSYLRVPNYISPAFPQGNKNIFRHVYLTFFHSTTGSVVTVKTASGPGADIAPAFGGPILLPLDGVRPN